MKSISNKFYTYEKPQDSLPEQDRIPTSQSPSSPAENADTSTPNSNLNEESNWKIHRYSGLQDEIYD
jgi:hypothetical protein